MGEFDGDNAMVYQQMFEIVEVVWTSIADTVHKLGRGQATILDLASGPGEPTCVMAKRFPRATITGSDVAPGMVELAKQRAKDKGLDSQLSFEVLDVHDMSSIPSASVDVITCSFGVMFLEDPNKGMSEVFRCLKPGGHFVASVWEDVGLPKFIGEIMTAVLGTAPPPTTVGPMAWSSVALQDQYLTAAGFYIAPGHNTRGDVDLNIGPPSDLAFKKATILVAETLKELQAAGKYGDVFAKAREAFDNAATSYMVNGDIVTNPGTWRLIVATKPEQLVASPREYISQQLLEPRLAKAVGTVIQERPFDAAARIAELLRTP
jgi:SAM-dependent methyltransferase